jgi:hypothetical protein
MIANMNFTILGNKELFTFGQMLLTIADELIDESDSIGPFADNCRSAMTIFGKGFSLSTKNAYTEILEEKDVIRDKSFLAFRNYMESCTYRQKEGWAAAAEKITNVIRKHGWHASHMGYKAQSAALTSMIMELNEQFLAEVDFLGGREWLTEMETAQKDFETVMMESISSQSAQSDVTLTDIRPKVINAFKSLISIIDLRQQIANNEGLTKAVGRVNELITQTMTPARAAVTRNQKNKSKNNKNEDTPNT